MIKLKKIQSQKNNSKEKIAIKKMRIKLEKKNKLENG
jgi:hypothetical protein